MRLHSEDWHQGTSGDAGGTTPPVPPLLGVQFSAWPVDGIAPGLPETRIAMQDLWGLCIALYCPA